MEIHFRKVFGSFLVNFRIVFHFPYCLQYISVHNRCFISASSGNNDPAAVSAISLVHRINTILGPQPKRARNDLSSSGGALILNGSFSIIILAKCMTMSSTVGGPPARARLACTLLASMVVTQRGQAGYFPIVDVSIVCERLFSSDFGIKFFGTPTFVENCRWNNFRGTYCQ